MAATSGMLVCLPCRDSDEMAVSNRRNLRLSRGAAAELGRTAVEAAEQGYYRTRSGGTVGWRPLVERACDSKVSLAPDAELPRKAMPSFPQTQVQVANETTLVAARHLVDVGHRPLALNFANGVHPGGGFLHGALAQEEALCRSSALYATLVGDRMYAHHRARPQPDSTDWAIYSPQVPVFRLDDGTELDQPWLLDFLTCAAPVASTIGQPLAGYLLSRRIHRVLAIAQAFGHTTLVLGAWGCGAFANDPRRTARDFRDALEGPFAGTFSQVVFAVTDWSPERRFLGAFRDVFAPDSERNW